LGSGHKLVIQQPVGTAHTWRSIMKLPSSSGSAELPGLPLGVYRLRIADLVGRRVLAQQALNIRVFGEVPFSTLLRGVSPGAGVYATSTTSFPYVTLYEPSRSAFSVRRNPCVAVHVAFVPGGFGYPNGSNISGTVTVVQESRDAVSASASYNSIGSLDAELVPGQSWSVNVSWQGEHEPLIYINGYAVCDSRESFFS
jgi:hypothetical protein